MDVNAGEGEEANPARRPSIAERARRFVRRIASEHASPGRLFAACVVGAIVGSTPFFGLHLVLCIAVASLLRLNRVAVYAAANVSIPPLAPALAFACIEVGSRVLHGRGAPIGREALRSVSPLTLAADVLAAWTVGAPIVGGAIGVVLGSMVAIVARGRTPSDPALAAATARVVERFATEKPAYRHYVRWKLRLDPVYRAIAAEVPAGAVVVELGTGLGILPLLLLEIDPTRRAVAIDWDQPKIEAAARAGRDLSIEFERADLRDFVPPPCDVLALVDVLHYFDHETQAAILARAAAVVRPGGLLLVRDGDTRGIGARWTGAIERIAVAVGWNRSAERPRFRAADAIAGELRALGFACDVADSAGPLHPGNVLLRARRSAT